MTRDELVTVMRAHCKQLGRRDRLAHCSCGWASDPIKIMAPWGQHQHHLADVILALVEADSYDERPEVKAAAPARPALDWFSE